LAEGTFKMMKTRLLIFVLFLLAAAQTAFGAERWWREVQRRPLLIQDYRDSTPADWSAVGKHTIAEEANGEKSLAAEEAVTVSVGKPDWTQYTAEFSVRPVVGPVPLRLSVYPAGDDRRHPVEANITFARHDKEGNRLAIQSFAFVRQYNLVRFQKNMEYVFRPTDKEALKPLQAAGIQAQPWTGRTLHFKLEAGRQAIRLWMEGRSVLSVTNVSRQCGGFRLELAKGDRLGPVRVHQADWPDSPYLALDLSSYANNRSRAGLGDGIAVDPDALPQPNAAVEVGGIPFCLVSADGGAAEAGGGDNFCLKRAEWTEWKTDPSDYYEKYDSLPAFQGDPRTPMLVIPNAGYSAVYVLGMADTTPDTSRAISWRIGRRANLGLYRDTVAEIPRWNEAQGRYMAAAYPILLRDASGKPREGRMFLARIPVGNVFPQDFQEYGDFLDVEVTKELKLAVRQPDPARFRVRPLGLPSSVHVFGMTFEQSPVQMGVTSDQIGHVSNEPQLPAFRLLLRNITGQTRAVSVLCTADDHCGAPLAETVSLTLAPGTEAAQTVVFKSLKRGYYNLCFTLQEQDRPLLVRRTSCAILPPDTRDRSAEAPWGTWSWNGGHNTPYNQETNVLARKLGIRYTFGGSDSELARHGLRHYASPRVQAPGAGAAVVEYLERYPHAVRRGLTFHEDAISGAHVMRPVDCVLERSPYRLDESEQKRFDKLFADARAAVDEVRRAGVKDFQILLGNGNPHLVEEFLRHKYPADLFDAAGNENCAFMRPTEFPPDNVSFNTIWIFRQVLDAYGYRDKPIDACYEWMCRATSPGNLSEEDQANYYVRDGILALCWGFKHIGPGEICDVGNSYYYSNWGAGGFCHAKPELNPKPAYVAFATMTWMLDKARFVKLWDTGTRSLYCAEFLAGDHQRLFAVWTLRGRRDVALSFAADGPAEITDWRARQTGAAIRGKRLTLAVTPSPLYLKTAFALASVAGGACTYAEQPSTQQVLISRLDSPADWRIEKGRNVELETYNFETPRREGRFAVEVAGQWEGQGPALRITPRLPVPGTAFQPMYQVMALDRPVSLPGLPKEVGLRINGNSGWGRVIFELRDASGQRWISIGCPTRDNPTRWMADWLPADELAKVKNSRLGDWNTDDSEARSRINFDGWRYVSFPLPGQYEGEQYHWPRNCYWKYDQDGIVHYPLSFTKLVVELREKSVYGTEFIEPARQEIYLKDLIAAY
jgi:hypothetical protein